MANLVVIRGPSAGKRYPISGECIVGRSFNSDIYVGDLNVSRRHARLLPSGDGFLIEDLGSGNGTFVNEHQVSRKELTAHDVVRIGSSSFRYEVDTEEAPIWDEEVLTAIGEFHDFVDNTTGDFRIDPRSTAQHLQAVARQHMDAENLTGQRAQRMLEAVYEVADFTADELDQEVLLDKILTALFDIFPQADRGFVLLAHPETKQLVPCAVRRRRSDDPSLSFSQTIVDKVIRRGRGVIGGARRPASPRAIAPKQTKSKTPPETTVGASARGNPPQFDESSSELSVIGASKIGAPLIFRAHVLGTIHLEASENAEPFTGDDLALLSAVARQAALAITHARASLQLVEQERLEADLQMARRIQSSFLPRRLPSVESLCFECHYAPAQHVGGDFYDVIGLPDGRVGILVGDVSGKGVSAALMMAKLTTAIRIFTQTHADPAKVLTAANRTIIETEQDAMFATVLFMLLDLDQKVFSVANAGHQPPIVCGERFHGISELDDATSVALGVVKDTEYRQETYKLVQGDVIVMYTDGINEALNRRREEYGMRRLHRAISSAPPDVEVLARQVVSDVRRFSGTAPQSDDQTLVVFGLRDERGSR